MKKLFFIMIILIFSTSVLYASDPVHLEGFTNPKTMLVVDGRLYVTEATTIYMYSMKNYELIKKFGEKGSGPGEFEVAPEQFIYLQIYPLQDKLLINSMGKISYYSFSGDFLSERKVPTYLSLCELGNHFVSSGVAYNDQKQMVFNVCLYDENMNKIKELYRSTQTVGKSGSMSLPYETIAYPVWNSQVFIINGGDFSIDVFDENDKLYSIQKEYTRREMDDDYKEKTLKWFKEDSPFKQYFVYFQNSITFKSHYPAIKDILVTGGKIYCLTYKTKEDLNELIVMDLKGKELDTDYVPMPAEVPFEPFLYSIDNGKYYTMMKDKDSNSWLLYVESL